MTNKPDAAVNSVMLKPYWGKLFKLNTRLGIALVLLLGIPRVLIVLNANVTGNYQPVSLIFLCMWLAPFVLLTRHGRNAIGIKRPAHYAWLLYAFFIGAFVCLVMYAVAQLCFAYTISNWFVYIAKSYTLSGIKLDGNNRQVYFIIYAITSVTFSPVGEELFYRGIVHQCFVADRSDNKASVWDSFAFALTHLAHFGIVYMAGGWTILVVPGILWVLGMFLSSRVFYWCKVKSGSIFGAMASHAGFNLMMIYLIFYHIL